METSSGGSAASGGTTGSSFLPWHLIPSLKPGETEINEYTRRLEFLANIWPPEHLPQLAPRACMLCEGTAFANVVRLDPEKLRVGTTDGVKLVVKTLGGVWVNPVWKRSMRDSRGHRSKFLGEVPQGSTKGLTATKTYDANMIDELEPDQEEAMRMSSYLQRCLKRLYMTSGRPRGRRCADHPTIRRCHSGLPSSRSGDCQLPECLL